MAASSGWPGPNSSPAKSARKNPRASPVSPVQNENRLARARAHSDVVQAQLRQHFASVEPEVADHPVAFDRSRVVSRADQGRSENKGKQGAGFHGDLLANSTFSYIRSAGRRCTGPEIVAGGENRFAARRGESVHRAVSEIELRAMLHAFSETLKRLHGKPRLNVIEGNYVNP